MFIFDRLTFDFSIFYLVNHSLRNQKFRNNLNTNNLSLRLNFCKFIHFSVLSVKLLVFGSNERI